MIGRGVGRIAEYCGTKSKGMGPKCEVMEALLEGFNWRKRKGEGRGWKGGNLERQNCRIGRQALGVIRGRNCDHSLP